MTRRSDEDRNQRASFWRAVLLGYAVAALAVLVACLGR